MLEGMQPDSPPIPTNRSLKISAVKPCPNWQLIKRDSISDDEFKSRWLMLAVVREKMLASPRRRLVPVTAWEEVVEFSILWAVTTWKGNGEGKCPLTNYAWVTLGYTAAHYWNRNKVQILDAIELDRDFMTPD